MAYITLNGNTRQRSGYHRVKSDKEINTEKMASILESVADAIYIISLEGDILSWNEGAFKMYGYTEEEALNLSILHLMPQSHFQDTFNLLNKLKDEHSIEGVDSSRMTKNGKMLDVWFHAKVLLGKNGKPKSIAVTERNLIGAKSAAGNPEAHKESIKYLSRGIQDYVIFTLNDAGVVTSWNMSASRLYGYKSKEIIGKKCTVFYDQKNYSTELIQNELHIASVLGSFESQGWRVRRDKTLFWAHVVVTAIKDRKGNVTGFAKSVCDRTEAKKSQQAIQRSHKHFQSLIENALDLITVLNKDGMIVFQSPSCKRFLDYSPEEVLNRNVFDFIHTGDLLNVLQSFSGLIRNQSCEDVIEFRIRRKNGGWNVMEATAINLLEDPDINGIIVNSRDVSDRKNLDEQILKASESECSRIAQELHDGLNQDLAAIEFMSKSLERKLEKSSAPELADAQNITRQLNHAIQKTRRLSKGIYPLGISSVGLASSLTALADDIKNQHNVDCVMNCDDMTIPSDEVATHVYHIVREAFKNAIRHGRATQITVSAIQSNGKYIIEISDNGTGMKPKNEVREGIGLQIMRHRSRIINGSLGIHPQASGAGTKVVCSFPVNQSRDRKDD